MQSFKKSKKVYVWNRNCIFFFHSSHSKIIIYHYFQRRIIKVCSANQNYYNYVLNYVLIYINQECPTNNDLLLLLFNIIIIILIMLIIMLVHQISKKFKRCTFKISTHCFLERPSTAPHTSRSNWIPLKGSQRKFST